MMVDYFIKCMGLLLLAFSFVSSTTAQTKDSTLLWSYPLSNEVDFVTKDVLQQIYVATDDGHILKLNKEGQLLFDYNNKRLGQIGVIDASNPFNVLVYYPELATVILLDRTLSEIKTINLFDLQIFEPNAVALSNDNHIWVYDPINFQLKKISRDGEVLFQSKYLNQTTNIPLQLTFLLERDNQIIASDTTNGVFIFDAFGQLKKRIAITGISPFQLIDNQLIYQREGNVHSYALATSSDTILRSFADADHILLLSDRWVVVREKGIFTFGIGIADSVD